MQATATKPQPGYDIDAWRAGILLLASAIPMNACSQAPLTHRTRAAAERYLESWNRRGMDWEEWMAEVNLARAAFARLINASPDEIAVFASVSDATSALASALDFSGHRRRIVASEAEFPTIGHVWLAQQPRGARVSWVPLRDGRCDAADYDPMIDGETVIVSASHGHYLNGAIQDVGAIAERAHAHGALLYVDAYQTAGAVPIDVRATPVDFLAAGCLKYLMGTAGIAFLYVRRELIERLHPTVTGWFGRVDPFAFRARNLDWAPTARRFDTGTPPVINAYIARAGMEIIEEVGVDRVRDWHRVLASRLADGGGRRGLVLHGSADVERRTACTAFVVDDSHAVERAMRSRGVLPSARRPVIRLAPHFFNTLHDVDSALDILAEVVGSTAGGSSVGTAQPRKGRA